MKLLRSIFLIFTVICVIAVITTQDTRSVEALSKLGSRSEEVRQIQTNLSKWGYNIGPIDSIYGAKTQAAVRQFQKNNGLVVDGIAGPKTLAKMGISSSSGSTNSDNNINLLARMISAESRGEPYSGQVAVGAVILNRVKHPSFPNTIEGVLYQPGAFTALADGQWNVAVASSAYQAARDAMNGSDPSGGAIYYYNPAKTSNKWILSRKVISRIGAHVFAI